nr:hypothetical protein [Xenorhabdus beddingii]
MPLPAGTSLISVPSTGSLPSPVSFDLSSVSLILLAAPVTGLPSLSVSFSRITVWVLPSATIDLLLGSKPEPAGLTAEDVTCIRASTRSEALPCMS